MDIVEDARRQRRARTQAIVTMASIAVTGVLAWSLLDLAQHPVDLRPQPRAYRFWYGMFEIVNVSFLLVWSLALTTVRVHDDEAYTMRWRGRPVRRDATTDLVLGAAVTAIGVLWGVLCVFPAMLERVAHPPVVPYFAPAVIRPDAVLWTLVAYFGIVALNLVVLVIGLRLNPADLRTYRRAFGARRRGDQ